MIMPGNGGRIEILLGSKVKDEGRAEVVSLDDVIDTPTGKFQQLLKTEETTTLEKEYKFYAPGLGLIQATC
jgi:hypothetical protein